MYALNAQQQRTDADNFADYDESRAGGTLAQRCAARRYAFNANQSLLSCGKLPREPNAAVSAYASCNGSALLYMPIIQLHWLARSGLWNSAAVTVIPHVTTHNALPDLLGAIITAITCLSRDLV